MSIQKAAHIVLWAMVLPTVSLAGVGAGSPQSVAELITIEGVVKDQLGQALPGVSVVALLQSGGVATVATTGQDGSYLIPGHPEGIYRVHFWLQGFKGIRRNHVHQQSNATARVDVVLSVRPLCECVHTGLPPRSAGITGQVVDDAGNRLPFARVELVGPHKYRETTSADTEGRFLVRPPAEGQWTLTASDSGFNPVVQSVSSRTATSLTFRLRPDAGAVLPDIEYFDHECACPEFFWRRAAAQ